MQRTLALSTLALLALAVGAARGADDPPASPLAAEAQRLLAASRQTPAGDPNVANARREAEKMLERSTADEAAGRTALAFEELARGRTLLRASALGDEQPAAASDMKAFERLWQEKSAALTTEEKALRALPWGATPDAVRAVAESAQGKIVTLLEASRAYAAVTSPGDGLFYLGQARASAELARLGRTLPAPAGVATVTPTRWRSILPELDALQGRVNAIFQPPLSIDRHSDFIRLNAALKLAFELDAAELYAGALYQYLDATEQLALLAPAGHAASDPGPALAAARARLTSSGGGASLGALFLQRAEAVLAQPAAARTANDVRSVQVLAEQVLPAYFAVLDRGETQALTKEQAASVTITLVRWPYT